MSTPQTTEQLKTLIDQNFNAKTGQAKSINPANVGDMLKTIADFNESKLANNNNNSNNNSAGIIIISADPSLDITQHKHRLVMNDGGVAKLANMSPAVDGVKGKYRITTDSLPIYPVGAEYNFDFGLVNFIEDQQVMIPVVEDENNISAVVFIAKLSPSSSHEFQIGLGLNDSLDNLIATMNNTALGAWEYERVNNSIIFKNTNFYTGIGYIGHAVPTIYNDIDSIFNTSLIGFSVTQTVQAVDGDLILAYKDAVENTNNYSEEGVIIKIADGSCTDHVAIHVLGILQDWSSIGITTLGYGGWSIPQNAVEFSKILKENFLQNPYTFFNVVADGHSLTTPEAWIEIQEMSTQTDDNCNTNLINFNQYYENTQPFSTWFVTIELQTPQLGSPPMLKNTILGFLQDIVNGVAYISDSNINIGVLEDIPNNSISQGDIDAIVTDFENSVNQLFYILGENGKLKKFLLIANSDELTFVSLAILGGATFIAASAANAGEEIIVRRGFYFGN